MQNPYIFLLRKAWKYAFGMKRRFMLIYSLFVVANIAVACNPLLYGWFIDSLQREGTDALKNGWIYVSGFLGLRLLEWIFHGPARVMERQLGFKIARNFLEDLYHKVLHLPASWHQDNHSGSTINKLRKAHEALRDFFQQGFVYLQTFGKFFFSFCAMLYFSPLFGTIAILIGIVTVLIIMRFDKPFIKTLKEVHAGEHQVSATLFDSLSNIVTVITLRLQSRMQHGLMGKLMDVFPPFKRNATINEWKWFCVQMMVGLIYATITLGYVYQNWVPGEMFMFGGLVVLIGYVNQFTSVFNDVASQYTQITRYQTEIQNTTELENSFALHCTGNQDVIVPADWTTIDVENLAFTRHDIHLKSSVKALADIRLKLQKGKRIALIGESGSGKSTLLSILRGLQKADGEVITKIDEALRIPFEGLADQITLFPQEPEIFENTILYNITLGLPFDERDVMLACESAQFADVVRRLPKGLNTHIQEKGVNLSGGQKQRLALARGSLAARDSNIILMDEPTSSVDPRTEMAVYQNLFNTFHRQVIVSSLHRFQLLYLFDYVYILKDGSIADQGTFEELSRYSLVFKELCEHQAQIQGNAANDKETSKRIA